MLHILMVIFIYAAIGTSVQQKLTVNELFFWIVRQKTANRHSTILYSKCVSKFKKKILTYSFL